VPERVVCVRVFKTVKEKSRGWEVSLPFYPCNLPCRRIDQVRLVVDKTERLDVGKPNTYTLNQEIIAAALRTHDSRSGHWKSERIDTESLKNRVDGDLDLLRDLVALFAEEAPRLLGQIEGAIERGSATELEKASHKLKGSVLQFSASAAAAAALELEQRGRSGSVAGAGPMLNTLKNEIGLLQEALQGMLSDP